LLDNNTQRGYLISLAKSKGKEIQARSIFLQGLFFKEIDEIPKNLKPLMPYLRIINKVARDHKISIEQLALCYALQHNEIDYTIIGVDSLDQLKRNLETSKMTVSKDAITAIDLINVKETELLYPKNWA